jgi:uncharacterized protein (DUF1697 family)
VRTYIASGNVVFESAKASPQVKALLEKSLEEYAGKPVGVVIRTPEEMAAVLAENPFSKAAPNRTMAIFLDASPPADALKTVTGMKDEKIKLGRREIYVLYGCGHGRVETEDSRCQSRDGAEHEYGGETRRNVLWWRTNR